MKRTSFPYEQYSEKLDLYVKSSGLSVVRAFAHGMLPLLSLGTRRHPSRSSIAEIRFWSALPMRAVSSPKGPRATSPRSTLSWPSSQLRMVSSHASASYRASCWGVIYRCSNAASGHHLIPPWYKRVGFSEKLIPVFNLNRARFAGGSNS